MAGVAVLERVDADDDVEVGAPSGDFGVGVVIQISADEIDEGVGAAAGQRAGRFAVGVAGHDVTDRGV